MRNLVVGFLLILGIAAPQFAWADNPTALQSRAPATRLTASDQLQNLLENLDIGLIAKAYAAECKDEGEICKTNADCCSGLECSGDPQTTCRPAE
jgi:hypothetical protein